MSKFFGLRVRLRFVPQFTTLSAATETEAATLVALFALCLEEASVRLSSLFAECGDAGRLSMKEGAELLLMSQVFLVTRLLVELLTVGAGGWKTD